MKEFRSVQYGVVNSSLSDEAKFTLTKQLVIDTELKLKELRENENS